jgi:hypothetical protein
MMPECLSVNHKECINFGRQAGQRLSLEVPISVRLAVQAAARFMALKGLFPLRRPLENKDLPIIRGDYDGLHIAVVRNIHRLRAYIGI